MSRLLTDAEIAELRLEHNDGGGSGVCMACHAVWPCWTILILNELEQRPLLILDALEAAEADLRALRAAVRAMPEPREWHAGLHWCPACKGGTTSMHTTPVTHAPDCPWAVARALAGEEGAE